MKYNRSLLHCRHSTKGICLLCQLEMEVFQELEEKRVFYQEQMEKLRRGTEPGAIVSSLRNILAFFAPSFEPALAGLKGPASASGMGRKSESIKLSEGCFFEVYAEGVGVTSEEEHPPSVRFIDRAGNVTEITAEDGKKGFGKWKEWRVQLSGKAGYLDDPDKNIIYIMEVQEDEKPD